jgi:type IV pilus assembly protein PilW
MRHPFIQFRQRGASLVELMVGLIIGLLVVLVAMSSLITTRDSARTMTDDASLEQKASLVMMQIGQQISQAGGIVGIANSANPALPYLSFDTSAVGGVNSANPLVSVFGVDGGDDPDALVVSYTAANDISDAAAQARNCVGDAPETVGTAQRVVSQFFISKATGVSNLVCNDDTTVPSTQSGQPLAGNVTDLKVSYLLVDGLGNVTLRKADDTLDWTMIAGVKVCLEMQGDIIKAPGQKFTDCRGEEKTVNDGRMHRTVTQVFYFRNVNA